MERVSILRPRAVQGPIDAPPSKRMLAAIPMNLRVLFIATFLSLPFHAVAEDPHYPILPLGSPAPDFNLPGVDGKSYSLKDFAAAKVLAIIFTSNHCPTGQLDSSQETRLYSTFTAFWPTSAV